MLCELKGCSVVWTWKCFSFSKVCPILLAVNILITELSVWCDLHTRQLEMERIMFVFFWSESPSLYMCIQQLWKCDSSYAGYCTNRTGSHTSHQIGVGIEFLSLLLWDCELTWPSLHSCKAGVIPLLFLSCADSSFCILVSAILCFFVSSSLNTSNKISLCWLVLVVEEDAFR
jgi:hypothetical protein